MFFILEKKQITSVKGVIITQGAEQKFTCEPISAFICGGTLIPTAIILKSIDHHVFCLSPDIILIVLRKHYVLS